MKYDIYCACELDCTIMFTVEAENEEEAINIIKNGKRSKYSMEIIDCNIPEVDDILEITEY